MSRQRESCDQFQGKRYTFDKILEPTVTQSQVYDATAKNIVSGMMVEIFILLSHYFIILVFRCFEWLQWDNLCLRSDLLGKDSHHGGRVEYFVRNLNCQILKVLLFSAVNVCFHISHYT